MAKSNRGLQEANKGKNDEFYTQLRDIADELKHYRDQLRGKVILCNCDDPFESNFFKYFAANFNTLGLRKLIATSYARSSVVGGRLPLSSQGLKPDSKEPYVVEINEVVDMTSDGAISMGDVEALLRHDKNVVRPLESGDFRSEECVRFLSRADIVITNPPFSLFREYVSQLVALDKKFLIIGNINAVTYKEVFPLIAANRLWFGASIRNGGREFRVPDDYPLRGASCRVDANGVKYIRVKDVRWFTNMGHDSRHNFIPLYKKYTAQEYPKYDNYDGIEVSRVKDIPVDYHGVMGVPITFLDKYNPDQFEIVAFRKGDDGKDLVFTIDTQTIQPYFRILIRIAQTPSGKRGEIVR